MSRFKLLYFVIFIINLCIVNAQISDKRLCVDEECKVPISLAKSLVRYSSPDSRILSFAPNVDITIYSKSAGSNEDLWGGEINGKRGYIPKRLIKETKVFKKPTLLVDTDFSNDTGAQQVPSKVEPAKVVEPYEVVDGTTIYLSPQEDISPTSTESPIQTTALPVAANKGEESKETLTEQTSPSTESALSPSINQETPPAKKNDADSGKIDDSIKDEVTDPVKNIELSKEKEPEAQIEVESKEKKDESKDDDDVEVEDEDDDEGDEDDDDDEEGDEEIEELEAVIQEDDQIKNKTLEIKTKETIPKESPQSTTSKIEDKNEDEPKIDADTSNDTTVSQGDIKVEAPNSQLTESTSSEDSAEILQSPSANSTIQQEQTSETEKEAGKQEISIAEKQEDKQETLKTEGEENKQVFKSEEKEDKQETSKAENEDAKPETLKPVSDHLEEINKDEIKTEDAKEQAQAPEIETTTQTPELEVPHPFMDDFAEATPNPADTITEEVKKTEEPPPIMPPLGLFGNPNINHPTSENVINADYDQTPSKPVDQEEEKKDENSQLPEEDVNKGSENSQLPEEDVSKGDEDIQLPEGDVSIEADDFSFKEDDINSVANEEKEEEKEVERKIENEEDAGFFSGILSAFSSSDTQVEVENKELTSTHVEKSEENHEESDEIISVSEPERSCDATSACDDFEKKAEEPAIDMELFTFNSDVFLYLVTTAVSVIIFLFGYIAFDKSKREGPLIARINNLEKEILILVKENQILQEKVAGESGYETNDRVSSEVVENLKQELVEMTGRKNALEEQVQLLEKELENSTEVGMELNRMLSEILNSEGGSDVLKANVEHLQRQLVEQQATINSINETLAVTNTENHELRLELELSNKKVLDLQAELDKVLLNVLKIEEEKEAQQAGLENEVATYRRKYEEMSFKLRAKEEEYEVELKQLKNRLDQTERNLELKLKEHDILVDTIKQLKAMKANDGPSLRTLLDASGLKAEVQQLKAENQRFSEQLRQEEEAKSTFEKRALAAAEEARILREKYDEADKLRLEMETKLEVLSSYFKDREAQLQKEIAKHESLWEEKQGEASSITERIKFMQEQLQNYKAQTESLKQEIMSQEVELKSQISVLEKKAHENWVSARQAERKLEEAKQEAAQLRHRLTLRERAIQEDKSQHRFQSPIEQNGDMPVSPPIESPASPPLLFGARDHITKSPAIPGLPPFLPPPPGVPFMPPPLPGVPPFMPPPPAMFPGDHRPPPLGRMSSPPLNSRYSPSSRGYSPYDRNSSSPSDSEYGTSPPQRRGYSPFNSRGEDRRDRDYKRPPPGRTNGRSMTKDGGSSGSGHSNESLDKVSRSKV